MQGASRRERPTSGPEAGFKGRPTSGFVGKTPLSEPIPADVQRMMDRLAAKFDAIPADAEKHHRRKLQDQEAHARSVAECRVPQWLHMPLPEHVSLMFVKLKSALRSGGCKCNPAERREQHAGLAEIETFEVRNKKGEVLGLVTLFECPAEGDGQKPRAVMLSAESYPALQKFMSAIGRAQDHCLRTIYSKMPDTLRQGAYCLEVHHQPGYRKPDFSISRAPEPR